MSIRLYFPTIGKDSEPNILWQLSSCEDGQPGEIYLDKELCDIPDRNKTFWNPIKRAAECGVVRLTARGVKGVDYKEKLAGSSASGCAEFFRQYDCNGSKKNLNVAVSIHSECWNDAEQVSDVKAKIEFCRKEGMDLLLLPEKNFPGDIEATRLSDMDGVPENMSDRNMLILLAGEGWTKQLARLLEVPFRGERETTADEQTSH